jgi:hypothetical protein
MVSGIVCGHGQLSDLPSFITYRLGEDNFVSIRGAGVSFMRDGIDPDAHYDLSK